MAHGLDFANTSNGNNLFLQPSNSNSTSQSGYTIAQEIIESKTYLENLLGEGTIKGFAIPNIYTLDEYTSLLEYNYQYALGSGSSNSTYAHPRTKMSSMINISNQTSDEAQTIANNMIKQIDNAINYGTELNIYFHISDGFIKEISWSNYDCNLEALDIILKYLKEKQDEGKLNVKLPSEVYAVETTKKEKSTYYISVNGTSPDGLSSDQPMSYETAMKKTYISGDTILLKKNEIYFGSLNFNIKNMDDSITTISSYGNGSLPQISGYKLVSSRNSWSLHTTGIYKINLKDTSLFEGLKTTDVNSTNIGFIEDNSGNKYYNRKNSLDELTTEYDFYCDDTYLYIKIDQNPYDKLGNLKLATKINLMILDSNLNIDGINFNYTGAHGLVNKDVATVKNITIQNCVIENIGGSILKDTTRYGNGIEFYSTNALDIEVKNNIIRNVYDVAFTIQGTKGSGTNVAVHDNVLVNNTQDSEIWENGTATGVVNYHFNNNISVNQGRGWGYEARTDKYVAGHILFWGYLIDNTDIQFHNNLVYNPRRIYFVEQTYGTIDFFKLDKIKSDYNKYLLNSDSTIFRDEGNINTVGNFKINYNKDLNSTFTLIEPNNNIINISKNSDSITEIRSLFDNL